MSYRSPQWAAGAPYALRDHATERAASGSDTNRYAHRHGEPGITGPPYAVPVTPLPLTAGIATPSCRETASATRRSTEEGEVGREVGAQAGRLDGTGRDRRLPRDAARRETAERERVHLDHGSRRPPGVPRTLDALHRSEGWHPHLDAAPRGPPAEDVGQRPRRDLQAGSRRRRAVAVDRPSEVVAVHGQLDAAGAQEVDPADRPAPRRYDRVALDGGDRLLGLQPPSRPRRRESRHRRAASRVRSSIAAAPSA